MGPVKHRNTGKNGLRNVPLQWEVGKKIQLSYSTALMNPGEKTHEDT